MRPYHSILFDLDGTISRSAPGITRSLQYGLSSVGIEESDPTHLMRFIGPPLNVELRAAYQLSPAEIERVISRFRDRYESIGIFECELYPGMADLVRQCAAAGFLLAVASSKPEPHVRTILSHFGIASYFAVITGSVIEDELANKTGLDNKFQVIKKTLSALHEPPSSAVMVGDTKYDILGARQNGMDSIAVTYGYGTMSELTEARPTYTVGSTAELLALLCKTETR